MAKSKLGLQKEVSKIFTGIQIPKKNDAGPDARSTSPATPVTQHSYVSPLVTPSVPVIPSPVSPVLVTETPVPESVVTAPLPAAAKTIPPKPAVGSPKPFTIPEPPPQTVSHEPKQAVYEPPKPTQTTYEMPAPPSETMSAPAKQFKPEPVIRQPKESPLLKIIEKVKTKLLTSKHGVSGRQKVMLLLSPVLVIVLLIVVSNAVKKSHQAAAAPSKKATAAASAFEGRVNWELPAVIPNTLRDPTLFGSVSTAAGKNAAEGPVVKGIVYSEDNPCAVVGDRIVSAGDTVAGAKVEKINRDSVEFSMGDKKWAQKVER